MLVPIVVADVMATVCIYVRLMLLPITVADVITTLLPLIVILADVIAMMCWCYVTTNWCIFGWCYCQVADGMATVGLEWWQMLLPCGRWNSHWVNYFNLSSEVLNRTSSHMWGRLYLPIFLFRDGLLTLMYRASLMALMRFCSSLPTILKFSNETWWPVVLKWSKTGEGALRCSLNLSPNVLDDSPIYSSSHSTLLHLNL